MNKTVIPIKGMHCRSCEILVGEKLKEDPNIKNIQVSFKDKEARVYSQHPLDMGKTRRLIAEAGYEVGVDESKSWLSMDTKNYLDLAKSLVVLLILYFIAKKIGLFNINTGTADKPSNLLFVLLIGVTAGLSTCMALVGGLILGISARHAEKHPEATPAQKFRPHLYFNLGRILSYFVLGGLIGLIGKAFQLSGPTLGLATIAVGIVMLILGAQLTEIFPKLSNLSLSLPPSLTRLFGIKERHEREYSHMNSALVGALTFFVPCGFTQAMQLYAISTGSFWAGSLIMAIFALGTAPGLLGIGGLTSTLKGNFAKKFFKFTGLLVIFLAIFNISNGYRLTGFNIFPLDGDPGISSSEDPNVVIENGFQVVRMTQNSGGYSPNKFTVKNNIPVKWIIDSKDYNSCSSSIFMSKKNIKEFLDPGINTVEFTPTETGELKFSCSMGMYSGKFIVVENDAPASTPPDTQSPSSSNQSSQSSIGPNPAPSQTNQGKTQNIKATFDDVSWEAKSDITPNAFSVEADKPVHFEITANAEGVGCMSTIMIPGLVNEPQLLEKGETIKWDFTPKKGTYDITCAMGVSRGKLIAS